VALSQRREDDPHSLLTVLCGRRGAPFRRFKKKVQDVVLIPGLERLPGR
jgi:hypothetical protein